MASYDDKHLDGKGLNYLIDQLDVRYAGGGGGTGSVTGVKGSAESEYRTGDVSLSKANIGLDNVENKSSAAIRSEISSTNISDALGYIPADASTAVELDSTGHIPSSLLPSYVDTIQEYASISQFPATGDSNVIYVALDTNISYRWSGTTYVAISSNLALGETSSTAYRGDRGKIAYDDSQTNKASIGTLANLSTTVKTDLVSAINEIAQTGGGGGGGGSTSAIVYLGNTSGDAVINLPASFIELYAVASLNAWNNIALHLPYASLHDNSPVANNTGVPGGWYYKSGSCSMLSSSTVYADNVSFLISKTKAKLNEWYHNEASNTAINNTQNATVYWYYRVNLGNTIESITDEEIDEWWEA